MWTSSKQRASAHGDMLFGGRQIAMVDGRNVGVGLTLGRGRVAYGWSLVWVVCEEHKSEHITNGLQSTIQSQFHVCEILTKYTIILPNCR